MRKSLALASLLLGLSFLVPVSVDAQFNPLDVPCDELSAAQRANSEVCQDADNNQSQSDDPIGGDGGIVTSVANILAFVAGVAAVIIIVVSGVTMIVSAGDANAVKTARNTILYTAVGLIVIVLARSIVIFIVTKIG